MLVVMQRKASDNAKELYDALLKKFRVYHTALLQMELANFNSLKMAPNETASNSINRILEAKVKLTQYGYLLVLQDDPPVGTPKDWAQIECQICAISDVRWDNAVEQLTVHECLTMKESTDAKTEKVNMFTTKPTAKYHIVNRQ